MVTLIGRVKRAEIFPDGLSNRKSVEDADALAALRNYFSGDLVSAISEAPGAASSDGEPERQGTETVEFNLFSTGRGMSKLSLRERSFDVPEVNQWRPSSYYFTDPYHL